MTATNKCYNFVGFNYSPPLMNLPPPSSKSIFVEYHQLIVEKSQLHVEDSLKRAREEQDSFMEQFLYLK